MLESTIDAWFIVICANATIFGIANYCWEDFGARKLKGKQRNGVAYQNTTTHEPNNWELVGNGNNICMV